MNVMHCEILWLLQVYTDAPEIVDAVLRGEIAEILAKNYEYFQNIGYTYRCSTYQE